jgi:hypothetical protein
MNQGVGPESTPRPRLWPSALNADKPEMDLMTKKAIRQEPTPTPPTPPITLAAAIRQALDERGIDADKSAVERWLEARYPTLEYKECTFNATLSSIRMKLRDARPVASAADPSVHELLRAKEVAGSMGGVEALLGLIHQLESVAARVGGVARLRECLEALLKLER